MRKLLFVLATILASYFVNAQVTDADAAKALQLVSANKTAIGLSADELKYLKVSNTYTDKKTGLTMVYLQQSYTRVCPVFKQNDGACFQRR